MSTIITYPDALSLSRNLKKFLISSGVPVTFTLKKENQEILSEVYSPTPAGTIEIDIEDAVNDQLSLVLPISDVFTQPGTAADFSAIVDGVTKSFRVVKGGVCGLSITAVEFLKSNFLSWQPQTKSVTGTQPEWICYYAPEAAKIRCRFYNNNGTQAVTDLATLAAGECKSINVQFNRIINLNATKKLAYFDVWVENNSGVRLSYVQRYILIPGTNTERFFLFENSLGGIDCLSCTGEEVISPDSEFTLAEMDDETIQSAKRFEKWILQSTGFKNNIEALWIQDFFRSGQRYVVDSGTVKKIVLQESTIEINSRDAVNEFTFKYRSATDKGLLSLSRSLETPAGIEFPTAEQLFFLAPRLNEFLEADINESLLIPVQSPYQTVWKRLSVGALLSFLKAYADKFRHQHGNFPLLEKFSISLAGNLLFNGKEIAGGNGAVDLSNYYTKTTSDGRFAKLAGDLTQNFLANKFLSKTLVIPSAIPEGLAPGESAIYRRDTGFGGAIPEAGGLDRDAMWSELSINDSTKKVHLSHLPTIPYSQLSGTPFIPTWALAATKPSYGISEITGLQEALDNVSVDLSNYYTKTISDSRFAKLAGDLTQNFSAKKFLSKIFIIPSAVPEGLASGESAFYRRATGFGGANPGVGGLDRDAMWSELATNNTTKKIHNSHLNVPAWALAVSKPGYSYLEVGAAAASHEHSQYALSSSLSDYLPKAGGELTGEVTASDIILPEGKYIRGTSGGFYLLGYYNSSGNILQVGSSNITQINLGATGDIYHVKGSSFYKVLTYLDLERIMRGIDFNGPSPATVNPTEHNYGYINGYGSYISFGHQNYHIMLYGTHSGEDLQFRKKINGVWGNYRTLMDNSYLEYQSNRISTGVLIKTMIDYSQANGNSFYMEIKGNVYQRKNSCFTQVQGYIYNNTIVNYGVSCIGSEPIRGLKAMNINGYLCFWFPKQGYWEGYTVTCIRSDLKGSGVKNEVVDIVDSADPGGSKVVNLDTHRSQSVFQNPYKSTKIVMNPRENPNFGALSVGGNMFSLVKDENSSLGLFSWLGLNMNTYMQTGRGDAANQHIFHLILQPMPGNVGIGTESPGSKLHVVGDTKVEGDMEASNLVIPSASPSNPKLGKSYIYRRNV